MAKNSTVICNQCGSNEIEWTTKTSGICRYCRSKVIIEKEKRKSEKDGKIKYEYADVEKAVIKPMFSEKDFLRKVIMTLIKDKTVPHDILSAEFKPVKTFYRNVLLIKVQADINYSVTLGFKRTESHYSNHRKYTRSVIDWEVKTGHYEEEFSEISDISEKHELDSDDLSRLKSEFVALAPECVCRNEFEFDKTPIVPDDDKIKSIVENMRQKAIDNCTNTFVTKQYKYFKPQEKIKVLSVRSVVVPEYSVDFSYNGKQCTKRAFAVGNMEIKGGTIYSQDYAFTRSNIEEAARIRSRKSVKPYKVASICLAALFPIVSIIARNWIVAAVMLLLAAGGFILYKIMIPKKYKQAFDKTVRTAEGILESRRNLRISSCRKLLEHYGLSELSYAEIQDIRNTVYY